MRIWKGVLFVIVNDRSRYCFVARECLLENKKKKERKGEKKRSVYSRHGSWTGIDNSTLRDYLEILAYSDESFALEFVPLARFVKSGFRRRVKKKVALFWRYPYISMKHAKRRRLFRRVHFPVNAWMCIYDCQLLKGERALKLVGMSNDGAVAATV